MLLIIFPPSISHSSGGNECGKRKINTLILYSNFYKFETVNICCLSIQLFAESHINNLRYADHTTLMEERKDEVKSLLMRVSERGA